MAAPTPHVAILPSPGIGHVNPLLLLARRLVTLHHLDVTLFLTATSASTTQVLLVDSLLLSSDSRLRLVHLPPADVSPLTSPGARPETIISLTIKESLPALKSALVALSPRPTVLVVDLLGADAFDVADDLGMEKYLYFTSTAATLALMLYLPTLDREVEGEYVDLSEPVRVPGCKPIRPADVIDPMLDRKDDRYQWILHHAGRYREAHGVLINTCEGEDQASVAAIRAELPLAGVHVPPVYPVGPLVRSPEKGGVAVEWLDSQPPGSVIFVSFGSGGTLTAEQTTEVALGLERSGHRFLWVIRQPSDRKDSSFFTSGEEVDAQLEYLPEGYVRRNMEKGLLVPSWAPQVCVLAHPAVGAFLTHGGWNSVSESIFYGKPMVLWPLYAEQKMNAAMLVEEMKVGVRVKRTGEEGVVVGREVVEKAVRMVMEGEEGKEMRKKVEELRDVVVGALEEDGSSCSSLAEVVGEWQRISEFGRA